MSLTSRSLRSSILVLSGILISQTLKIQPQYGALLWEAALPLQE
jgi:hypothetical protein